MSSGTYNFTVTNSDGCVSSATANVVINTAPVTPSAPVVGTITQPDCTTPTGSVDLSGLPSGSWTINPGGISGSGTTTTLSGLSPGTYNYTVTNSDGCVSSATVNVVINTAPVTPSAPVVGTITQPDCTTPTGSVDLSGLPSGSWTINPGGISGSGTTTTISGLSSGTYNYTVTNSDGCVSSATVNVVINTAPVTPSAPVVGTITQPDCTTPTGSVDLSGLPSGSWTINPGGISGSGTTTTLSGLSSGTYNYTVTNSDGCVSSATANVVINTAPVTPLAPVVGTITQPDCTTPTGSVDLSGLPSGSWTINPGGISGSGTTTTLSGLSSGTYNFTVTNSDGCVSSTTVNVTIESSTPPAAPDVSITVPPTCTDPTATLQINSPLGADYSYLINGGAPQSSTVFSGLGIGSYQFTVIDNTTGCESAITTITINPQTDFPVITVSDIVELICNGGEDAEITIAVANGTGPYQYSWDTPNGVGNTASGLSSGTYTVTVTDANGCQDAESVSIIDPQPLTINFSGTNPTCDNADGNLVATPQNGEAPFTYLWDGNQGTTNTLNNISAGSYGVTITDNNGCSAYAESVVESDGNFSLVVSSETDMIKEGESVLLQADVDPSSTDLSYNWTPAVGLSCTNCASPVATPSETTTYTVTVISPEGCEQEASLTIYVESSCGELFIPTMFSPNSDGNNDGFCVHGEKDCILSYSIQVFNRWGQLVYESESVNDCWDGTYKGKPLNTASFVYRVYATTESGKEIEMSGNINLLR
ncbi:hypothetical protein GCM10009118_32810 [Wandonia haliotis]|uniref:PKD/Chitinase domain-containing protein n=1 Tax=Wandonia haliotis TaxID=574963 RepID=A0ABP3Y5Z0_9FLAO